MSRARRLSSSPISATLAKILPPRQSPEHEQPPSKDSSLLANRVSTSSHEATQRRLIPLSEDLEARIHEATQRRPLTVVVAALTCRHRCSHRSPLQLSPDLGENGNDGRF